MDSSVPYKFPSIVAVDKDQGGLLNANCTLGKDIRIPRKMLFIYAAGITRKDTLAQLPGKYHPLYGMYLRYTLDS